MRAPLTRHRVWSSDELFGEETEVLIAHGDQTYRLRRTRNGKLILCK
jgi:hemin uptake protein HemP